MRVLVVSVPSIGHARSMASVAALLGERGHDVHWAANETVGYVRAAGATLHSVLPDDLTEDGQPFAGTTAAEIDRWFLEHWFVPIAERALEPTLELARSLTPDLLVVDSTALWGAMVAEAVGVPWATYCPGLHLTSQERRAAVQKIQQPQQPLDWAAPAPAPDGLYWRMERRLNALRRGAGLPAGRNLDRISDTLLLCFTTRAVEFDGAGLPDQARCVGPVFAARSDLDPFAGAEPQLPPGDEPLVFVSPGRVQARLEGFVEPVLDGLADLGVRMFVAASGSGSMAARGDAVVHADGPVSQARLLDETAVLVGAGGFNTVNEALCRGVPVVALPVAGDEPALAGRIDELGLGIAIGEEDRDPARIRDAVARVLQDDGYRQRARAFALEARLANGVTATVRLLERLHRDGTVERAEDEHVLAQLPTRPRLARRFALAERGRGVALTSYSEDLEVADPAAADAVRWLWRTIDGSATVTDLLDRWDGDVNLLPIIGGLVRQGVLEDNVGRPRLDGDASARYRDQITLFSHAHDERAVQHVSLHGEQFQERLLAARVTIVGTGVLGSNVARHLCLSGVGGLVALDSGEVDEALVARGGWFGADQVGAPRTEALAAMVKELRPDLELVTGALPGSADAPPLGDGALPGSADAPPLGDGALSPPGSAHAPPLGDPHLVIVATDGFDAQRYAWVDEACQGAGLQWTSVRRSRMTVELGPTVIPGQTACFRCYELRRAANVPEATGLGGTHAGWFHIPAGAEWIALEAVKLLTGFGEAVTIGRMVVFDPLALSLVHHRVLRVPTCPRCKVEPHRPPEIPWMPR